VVTGSSGLIGSALVRLPVPRGGLRSGRPPHPPPEAKCVCVDVTDDASVEAGFQPVRYAYGNRLASVVHLAAYYDFSGRAALSGVEDPYRSAPARPPGPGQRGAGRPRRGLRRSRTTPRRWPA